MGNNGGVERVREKYIGKEFITNEGCKLTIIEYNGCRDVKVQFEDGFIKQSFIGNILKGTIKNPYHKSLFGIACVGEGPHSVWENGEYTPSYKVFISLLNRCKNSHKRENRHYIDCVVHESWLNFQNFAEWCKPRYVEGFQLDKDILLKGNRVYSSDTCTFIPQEINKLFTKRQYKRGSCVIGVHKRGDKFRACLSKNGKGSIHLGTFDTELEAFQAYKTAKEAYIKEVAEEWKDRIDSRVYEAMINYKVEITD